MAQTATSYFDYNTTPFMQMITTNPYSLDQQNDNSASSFGLNKAKYQGNAPRIPGNQNKNLFGDNTKAAYQDYYPTQSDVLSDEAPTPSFNVQGAHDAIDQSAAALMPGDGGVGDATAQQQIQQVKSDLSAVANSQNPDAVAKSLMNQPGYASDSFGGGLMSMGLAIMSGANPMEAANAGIKGQEYFDEKARKTQTSDYLRKNVNQLLAQDYTPDSISAAITNGDNSLLKQRQETISERAQREENVYQRNKQDKREDVALAAQNKREDWEHQEQIRQADRKDLLAMREQDKQEAKDEATRLAKEDAESQPFSTLPKGKSGNNAQMTSLAKSYDKNITNWRMADQAYNSLQGLENADDRTQLATMQAEGDRLARSLLGGNATLTPEQIKEITGSPMSMDKFADWLTTNTDQGRAKRAIEYMAKVAKASRDGYSYTIRNDVSKDRENMKRYNNNDPHKTTQDIMTVARVDPEMFMRPDELEEFRKSGRWIKTGGIHESYGKEKAPNTQAPRVSANGGALAGGAPSVDDYAASLANGG